MRQTPPVLGGLLASAIAINVVIGQLARNMLKLANFLDSIGAIQRVANVSRKIVLKSAAFGAHDNGLFKI